LTPLSLVWSWRKLFPDLDDDLQHFPNEENRKSEILDMLYAMSSFERLDKDDVEE
jgi:hypothetical protein